jgi:hypothetical protein
MKYLVIRQQHKRTKAIWDTLARELPLRLEVVDADDRARFRTLMQELAQHDYDRVVFDCNIRSIGRDYRLLQGIRNLVIFDNDLYHHFHDKSAYFGLFVSLLKTLPPHRVISTGLFTVENFRQRGLNISYLPKSYDPDYVHFLNTPRDIEFAFVGRIKHKIYTQRRTFLEELRRELDLKIIKTSEDSCYNETLNRIRFFLSADLGLNEFMAKNFEAMAAGCILCAVPTSTEEAAILGFEDMKNIVFYSSLNELKTKLDHLRSNPALENRIADAGRKLVEARHSDYHRAAEIRAILSEPMAPAPPLLFKDHLNLLKLNAYHLVTGN